MRHLSNDYWLFRNRKARRDSVLQKMSAMRAAKERKRLERPAPEPAPRGPRWHRLEFGVRDKVTGEIAWHDLRSVRYAATAFRLLLQAEKERGMA